MNKKGEVQNNKNTRTIEVTHFDDYNNESPMSEPIRVLVGPYCD